MHDIFDPDPRLPLAHAGGLQLRLRSCRQVVFADPVLLNRLVSNLLGSWTG